MAVGAVQTAVRVCSAGVCLDMRFEGLGEWDDCGLPADSSMQRRSRNERICAGAGPPCSVLQSMKSAAAFSFRISIEYRRRSAFASLPSNVLVIRFLMGLGVRAGSK